MKHGVNDVKAGGYNFTRWILNICINYTT